MGAARSAWRRCGQLASPRFSDQEFLAQLKAAWRGSDFQRNHDKIDRVFEWVEARFATAPKAERERLDAQLEWLSASLEGCEALVTYYDERWARANDTFANFHAGIESAKRRPRIAPARKLPELRRQEDADADAFRAESMTATAMAHSRWAGANRDDAGPAARDA
jgi:hypothetical protein